MSDEYYDDIPPHGWYEKPVITFENFIGTFLECPKKLLHDLQICKESGCYDKELRTYSNGMDGKTYYDISDLWRILHKIAGASDGRVIGMENGGIVEVSEMCVF